MKISLVNGHLKIDGKEVLTIVFSDGETMRFPSDVKGDLIVENSDGGSSASVVGDKSTAISGKNIIHGSVMNVKGDFRLGDG